MQQCNEPVPEQHIAVYHKFCTQFWQFEFLSEGQKSYVALAIRESLSITASKNRVYARCAFL
jgi:hypothetical protein